jgi:hypothetical protein
LPADLHLHTTSSDAAMSGPRQVELAAAAGLSAMAITDHNAVSAVPGAQFVAERWGVEVIAGAELDCNFHDTDTHIVALFLDLDRPEFIKGFIALQDRWRAWCREVLEEYRRAAGIEVLWEDVYFAGDVPVGGALVDALQRKGYDGPIAYKGGWGYGPPGARFVPMPLSPREVCDLVHLGGGVAILAHTVETNRAGEPKFVSTKWTEPGDFREILDMGIDGWECWRGGHSAQDVEFILHWGKRLGLLPAGGSDYHGPQPPNPDQPRRGGLAPMVPDEAVEALRARAATYR